MTDTGRNPLAKSFNAVSLIKFASPSMVMMLFMGLYTIVDTIFVARFVDMNALSSINIVCPVINIIVGLGTMLGAGGSAIVAQKMGSGKTEEASLLQRLSDNTAYLCYREHHAGAVSKSVCNSGKTNIRTCAFYFGGYR